MCYDPLPLVPLLIFTKPGTGSSETSSEASLSRQSRKRIHFSRSSILLRIGSRMESTWLRISHLRYFEAGLEAQCQSPIQAQNMPCSHDSRDPYPDLGETGPCSTGRLFLAFREIESLCRLPFPVSTRKLACLSNTMVTNQISVSSPTFNVFTIQLLVYDTFTANLLQIAEFPIVQRSYLPTYLTNILSKCLRTYFWTPTKIHNCQHSTNQGPPSSKIPPHF